MINSDQKIQTNIERDAKFMSRALKLASLGEVYVAPNPMVGAVIVYNEDIIGEGFHQQYGSAHAEVNAVQSVSQKELLSESTIYVTLEPCVHFGKTPPCTDLLIQHKFNRVVVACLDPNSKIAGKGIQKLKDAGIQVDVGILKEEAEWLNRRFFTYHSNKRPYVILKWAETKDGFIDKLPEHRVQGVNWITQPRMKLLVHKWRSQEQAIMVGWKTINQDNPLLNVREIKGKSPHKFIIDPKGNINSKAQVFQSDIPTTILTQKYKIENLPNHIEFTSLPEINSTTILSVLYEKNILSVFIEGGAETLKHFINDGLWDEAYQLLGDISFGSGIEAPILTNKVCIKRERYGKDLLNHFIRKK